MNLKAIDEATKGKVKTTGISDHMDLERSKVYPNPDQPRKSFENIEELASSIKVNGLIQAIAVVKTDKGYMIISGERRYRAICLLQLRTIKAHIVQADDKKILELALIENIQRDDLTDFEKAKFINQLWSSGNYEKKQDLAAAIGKPASYLSKVFKAIKLSDAVIADIEKEKKDIGLEILQELSNIKDEEVQLEVYKANPTREQIRNTVYLAKENKKYRDLEVPQVSPAKEEKKKIFEQTEITQGKHQLSWACTKAYDQFKHKYPITRGKNYKITIEEI